MTAQEFYDENYEDAHHFYTYVRGIAVVSPKKIQQAMENYHQEQVKSSLIISDEEIEKASHKADMVFDKFLLPYRLGFETGAKWMREQINKPKE